MGSWGSGASAEGLGRQAAGKLSHTLQAAGPEYNSKCIKPPGKTPLQEPIRPHQTCVLSLSLNLEAGHIVTSHIPTTLNSLAF